VVISLHTENFTVTFASHNDQYEGSNCDDTFTSLSPDLSHAL
jgi:hypothetical protein